MLLRTYLVGKLHGVRLTDKNVAYQGSITLSQDYLDAANLQAHELVQVVNVTTGARLTTYVIATDEPRVCILNGGAARHAEVGDQLIVMAFAHSDRPTEPRIAIVGDDNRIEQTITGYSVPPRKS
jgi:aspartate 1-decarboxylase